MISVAKKANCGGAMAGNSNAGLWWRELGFL